MSSAEPSQTTPRELLRKLVLRPDDFSPTDMEVTISHLLDASLSPSVAASLLTAMTIHKLDLSPTHISAAASALRAHALLVPFEGTYAPLHGSLVDIVGTGGDGHDTFNVSTTSAIVAAGAGCKVAKHGNRASSSSSGSADLIMSLDIPLASLAPRHFPAHLQTHEFSFLYAQTHHPAMRNVAAVRREIGFPTMFNIIGPLSNPARPTRMVVGVRSPDLGPIIASALALSGVERALVVCGAEKLDELSPAGESYVWDLEGGEIRHYTVHPVRDFGLPTHPLASVKGGGPEENAVTLRKILDGQAPLDDPVVDFILLNTAALLVVGGVASSFKDGVARARESITSGAAKRELEAFRHAAYAALSEEISRNA